MISPCQPHFQCHRKFKFFTISTSILKLIVSHPSDFFNPLKKAVNFSALKSASLRVDVSAMIRSERNFMIITLRYEKREENCEDNSNWKMSKNFREVKSIEWWWNFWWGLRKIEWWENFDEFFFILCSKRKLTNYFLSQFLNFKLFCEM